MDNLQEEVNECKKDILKIQDVVQRLYDELQSAWDQIDKLKKNESELQDELQSALDEIDNKLKNETYVIAEGYGDTRNCTQLYKRPQGETLYS